MENDIKERIVAGKKLGFRIYSLTKSSETTLYLASKLLLEHYSKDKYLTTYYTILKDLTINAIKANHKRLFFEDHSLNIQNSRDYEEGMPQYKKTMTSDGQNSYDFRAKERGVQVAVQITHSADGIMTTVTNNSQITAHEESRIRSALLHALNYDDILAYYRDRRDDEEGEGLGLGLAVILLKAEGIDPGLFRIFSQNGETTARFEIPFTSSYKPSR
ncbi:MAG: histidine kinase [Leptospira sp.]|nr:histidine kinase [Leptospira sp.]